MILSRDAGRGRGSIAARICDGGGTATARELGGASCTISIWIELPTCRALTTSSVETSCVETVTLLSPGRFTTRVTWLPRVGLIPTMAGSAAVHWSAVSVDLPVASSASARASTELCEDAPVNVLGATQCSPPY